MILSVVVHNILPSGKDNGGERVRFLSLKSPDPFYSPTPQILQLPKALSKKSNTMSNSRAEQDWS